jgi:hypothetical protein
VAVLRASSRVQALGVALLAAVLLIWAFRRDPIGAASNVMADVMIALTASILAVEYLRRRNRAFYACSVNRDRLPLLEALQAIQSWLRDREEILDDLAQPRDADDWQEYLPGGDKWNPYDTGVQARPTYPALDELRLPVDRAALQAASLTLMQRYAGSDVSHSLETLVVHGK